MGYLRLVAQAFAGIARGGGAEGAVPGRRALVVGDAGRADLPLRRGGRRPCWRRSRSPTFAAPLSAAQRATLDAAGAVLADFDRGADGGGAERGAGRRRPCSWPICRRCWTAPDLKLANLPLDWASPAFDVLQLEDYDWVTSGNPGASRRGVAAAQARLGYPPERQHYFAGFVLAPEDEAQWHGIAEAIEAARARGAGEVFVWALPQVLRDGFTWFDPWPGSGGDGDVEAFEDVRFPVALGREASVEPASRPRW